MALSVLDGGLCGLTYQATRILFYGGTVNRHFPEFLAVFQGFLRFSANRAMFFGISLSSFQNFFRTIDSRAIIRGLKNLELVRGDSDMRWRGERQSENIEDRRGMSRGGMAIGGGLGSIVVLIIALLLGADPRQLLEQAPVDNPSRELKPRAQPIPEEEELKQFVPRRPGQHGGRLDGHLSSGRAAISQTHSGLVYRSG